MSHRRRPRPPQRHHRDPERLALDPALGGWWRSLDQATKLLDTTGDDRTNAVDCLLNLGQKFVPCSKRGTHRSLRDCTLCAGDCYRGDATVDEVLLPAEQRTDASH
jgi:hypothetical protein